MYSHYSRIYTDLWFEFKVDCTFFMTHNNCFPWNRHNIMENQQKCSSRSHATIVSFWLFLNDSVILNFTNAPLFSKWYLMNLNKFQGFSRNFKIFFFNWKMLLGSEKIEGGFFTHFLKFQRWLKIQFSI